MKRKLRNNNSCLNCCKQCKWVPRKVALPIEAWSPHVLLSTKQCKENVSNLVLMGWISKLKHLHEEHTAPGFVEIL